MISDMTMTFNTPLELADKAWGETVFGSDDSLRGQVMSIAVVKNGPNAGNAQPVRLIGLMPTAPGREIGEWDGASPYAVFDHVGEFDQYVTACLETSTSWSSCKELFDDLTRFTGMPEDELNKDLVKLLEATKDPSLAVNIAAAKTCSDNGWPRVLWGVALLRADKPDLMKNLDLNPEDLIPLASAWHGLPVLDDSEKVRKLIAFEKGISSWSTISSFQVGSFRKRIRKAAKALGPCCKRCAERREQGKI